MQRALRLGSPAPASLLAAAATLALVPGHAAAQRAFDLQLYAPAPGPLSGVALERATPLSHRRWLFGLVVSEARDLLLRRAECDPDATVIDSSCRDADGITPVVSDLAQLELSAAFGLFGAIELGVVLPLSLVRAADDLDMPTALDNRAGLADLRLSAKLALLRGAAPLSLVIRASLPTGDDGQLRGERRWTATPTLVLDLFADAAGEPRLTLAAGYRLRKREAAVGLELDDEIDAGLSAGQSVAPWLRLLAEVRLRAGVGGKTTRRNEHPMEVDAGGRFALGGGAHAFVGAGTGLWPGWGGYGAPAYRLFAGLRLELGGGRCGVGRAPRCAGDDRDGDGIADEVDGCPSAPEDADGFADLDGCPDPDDDADGIADAEDACPRETEDRDGYQDGDGCPEPDNDDDGLTDGLDACAMDPEDIDDYQDADGCPEPGPEQPTISVTEGRILVSERIFFEFDRDEIRSVSMPLLDQLAGVVRALPAGLSVQVEGHTDDSGNPEHNLDLSYRRAQAVAAYLRSRGVPGERLRAVGRGALSPVAGNDTSEGRALNRRVEFVLTRGAGED